VGAIRQANVNIAAPSLIPSPYPKGRGSANHSAQGGFAPPLSQALQSCYTRPRQRYSSVRVVGRVFVTGNHIQSNG